MPSAAVVGTQAGLAGVVDAADFVRAVSDWRGEGR